MLVLCGFSFSQLDSCEPLVLVALVLLDVVCHLCDPLLPLLVLLLSLKVVLVLLFLNLVSHGDAHFEGLNFDFIVQLLTDVLFLLLLIEILLVHCLDLGFALLFLSLFAL